MGVTWLLDSPKFTLRKKNTHIFNIHVFFGDHLVSVKEDQSEPFQWNEIPIAWNVIPLKITLYYQ